ncbi:MAG: hypothetical protein RIB45_08670 [Marivibrio sp.]|uniref:nSTAND1 domain-containing NTPase n=1 Tax=Marivibrio sp. TaxID=2039719 RepID=UPI0032EB180F
MSRRAVKVFISSPGDVGQERLICARILERLQGEFGGFLQIEPILWEHEPLRASAHFQEEIEKPSDADVMVCILWSRLGTRLPDQFHRADGSRYDSGTEWEFEDALESFRASGKPDILVYKKTAPPVSDMSDEDALIERLQQKKKLDGFLEKWFGSHSSGFKSAFHPFETPDRFEEMAEEHLRRLMRAKAPQRLSEDEGAPAVTWTRGSPFRGLAAFQYEHAPVFFGRTRAIGEVKDALVAQAARGRAFVMVLGASGGGKSSLVRAGLVPTVCQPGVIDGVGLWRRATVRPSDGGGDAAEGLADALLAETALPELARSGFERAALAKLIARAPDAVVAPVRAALDQAAETTARAERLTKPPIARLILTVDQTEELFTTEALSAESAARFVDLIDALARSGLVYVIATMRDDFYHRTADHRTLAGLMDGEGQVHLLPPDFSEIGQMIRQPARAAGLRFEFDPKREERLDETLQAAAAKDPGALPLMSFVLDELFAARTEDGYLTFAAYDALGGLEGALAKRAEDVFSALDPSVQEALNPLLRRLVTLAKGEEDRPTARRPTLAEAIGDDAARRGLVDAFVEARLLVVDGDGGQPHIRVAHEALLTRWPRLALWLEADKEFLRLRARLADQAAHWREEAESVELLLPEGKPLFEARDLLRLRAEDLDEATIAFIEASYDAFQRRRTAEEAAQRRTLKRTRLLAAGMAVLALGAGVGGWLGVTGQRAAEAQRAVAESRAAEAEAARAEALRLADETAYQARRTDAARLAAEVSLERAEKQTDRALVKQSLFLSRVSRDLADAGRSRTALELALAALPRSMARPDRPYAPEAEAALYHVLANRRAPQRLAGHAGAVETFVFSADRTRMASVSADGSVGLWNAASAGIDGRPIFRLETGGVRATAAAVAPDGRSLVGAGADGRLHFWRAADGARTAEAPAHDGPVAALVYSADGAQVLSAGWDGAVAAHDASSGAALARAETGLGRLSGLAALPGGGWIAVGWDGGAILQAGQRPARTIDLRLSAATALAVDQDGARAAVGGRDGSIVLLEATSGALSVRLPGRGAAIATLVFSPDGERLLTGDRAGNAALWDPAVGRQTAILDGGGAAVVAGGFDPAGALVMTARADGAARLWRAADGAPLASLQIGAPLRTAALTPDGRSVATGETSGAVALWPVAPRGLRGDAPIGAAQPFARMSDRVDRMAFDPRGERLAAADWRGEVAVWRRAAAGPPTGLWRLRGHAGRVRALAFSPDGALLATAGRDGRTRLWRAADGAPAAVLYGPEDDVRALAFAPDGAIAATGADDGRVRLYDVGTGALLRTLETGAGAGIVTDLAWSDDGGLLAAAGGAAGVSLWSRDADWTARALAAPSAAAATRVAFSPDGGMAAAAFADGTVALWDTADGRALAKLEADRAAVHHLAFTADGRALAAGGESGLVRLWDARTGYPLTAFAGHDGAVEALSPARPSERLLTAGADGTLRLWDRSSGVALARPLASGEPLAEAALAPDGRAAAAGGVDGTLYWTPLMPDAQSLVDHARALRGRPLSPTERARWFLDVEDAG